MLNWFIISCGDIVNKRVAPAINAQPDSRLVGFYSTSRERARDFAHRFGEDGDDENRVAQASSLHADRMSALQKQKRGEEGTSLHSPR